MKTTMFYSKYEPQLYSILRVITGFLFLWHGSQKLFGFPHIPYTPPLYIILFGGTVEFFGGLMVMTGFLTSWAAFVCSGEMAYAYWFVHGTHAVLPLVNQGELAVVYCFLFLFISARGSGMFGIDRLLKRGKDGAG
jgi:putative oxidoreductase